MSNRKRLYVLSKLRLSSNVNRNLSSNELSQLFDNPDQKPLLSCRPFLKSVWEYRSCFDRQLPVPTHFACISGGVSVGLYVWVIWDGFRGSRSKDIWKMFVLNGQWMLRKDKLWALAAVLLWCCCVSDSESEFRMKWPPLGWTHSAGRFKIFTL